MILNSCKLGFQPEVIPFPCCVEDSNTLSQVQDFQPYYRFNARKIADLRIGAAILKEAVELDAQKQERLERSRRDEKAAAAAVVNNVSNLNGVRNPTQPWAVHIGKTSIF